MGLTERDEDRDGDRDLAFLDASRQAALLADGTVTAPELLQAYLRRIARLDPRLRCYRMVAEDTARREAAAAQRRLDAGERLPLLIWGEVCQEGRVKRRPQPSSWPPLR